MAWANSFVASATIRDAFKNAIALNIGGTTPDTLNLALYNNTIAPSIDTDPLEYSAAPWNANEVTGTNWAAGGVALSSVATALVAGTGVSISAGNVSVASTTISTGAYGCLIYDNTLATKNGIVAVYFGGTGYTTNNGTFAITWNVSGIAVFTLH